ncbi:MAG: prepilin-type N-terminal cleavage/methylation domain-containing protein [Candidatus Sumerlaeia bacterium]|nr:prepilin-type N-terminal cleavage/methylation domain-containing protein [Candidatus Sumerlaeia bacterium]
MKSKETDRRKCRGFTLIELLIVVAIIAILAAIAVPNFMEAQTRAKVSRVKSDMRTTATGLEVYRVDNNDYPPGFGLTVDPEDEWRFGLWLLSTPIAYVSSANFQDPMHPRSVGGGQEHPTQSTLQYNAMHNDAPTGRTGVILSAFLRFTGRQPQGTSVVPHGPNGFRLSPGAKSEWWTLFSNGPDGIGGFAGTYPGDDLEIRIVKSDQDLGQFLDMVYDPTNGTVSQGNIWRSGGSGLNAAGRFINSID